jgi:hypothetical protein
MSTAITNVLRFCAALTPRVVLDLALGEGRSI